MTSFLVFLLVSRLVAENFWDYRLLSLGGYDASILSAWSLTAIAGTSFLWVHKWPVIRGLAITKPILAFLATLVPGATFFHDITSLVNSTFTILPWVLALPCFILVMRETGHEYWISLVYRLSWIFIVFNLLLKFAIPFTPSDQGGYGVGEFFGLTYSVQTFAFLFVLLIPFQLYEWQKGNNWAALAGVLMSLYFVAGTLRRGDTAVGALLVSMFFVMRYRAKALVYIALITAVGYGTYGFLYESDERLIEGWKYRFVRLLEEDADIDEYSNSRLIIWASYYNRLSAEPLPSLFVGPGVGVLYEAGNVVFGERSYAHNEYINFLSDYGFMGLFGLAGLYRAFYKGVKSIKAKDYVLYCIGFSVLTMRLLFGIVGIVTANVLNFYFAVLMSTIFIVSETRSNVQMVVERP